MIKYSWLREGNWETVLKLEFTPLKDYDKAEMTLQLIYRYVENEMQQETWRQTFSDIH